MSEVSKHVLDQIKEEGIKPRPRWQFISMGVLLALALIFSIIAGGLVTGLIFLKLFDVQWDFVSFAGDKGLPNILEVLPIIWMALLVAVLLISVWIFEKTEKGYKYSPAWLVLAAIILSTALGAVLYFTKGAELFDQILEEYFPQYQAMEEMIEGRFHLPEMGILPGRVVVVESPTTMQLEDLRQHLWEVELAPFPPLPGGEMMMRPPRAVVDLTGLSQGTMVFVIGEKVSDDNFLAQDVRKKGTLPPPPATKMMIKNRFLKNHPNLKVLYEQEK